MATYELEWQPQALKALRKIAPAIRLQLLEKLAERCNSPRVPSAKLREFKDCYKIKLKSQGYRLVYQVIDQRLVVLVLSVGRRDDADTYGTPGKRRQ